MSEEKTKKELYSYQHAAIENLLKRLHGAPENHNILYQLPTGGGKTVIFSEVARRYIDDTKKKVLILTHRIELCAQTSSMLTEFEIINKIIDSSVKELPDQNKYQCFVAMVETLNNRLQEEEFSMDNIGLVIVDEAHYNSFSKLFKYFDKSIILGVTATPLSSSIKLPMNSNYNELIIGDSIADLVEKGFLAKANTYTYNVNLGSLTVGITGDYTVRSSERLYANVMMQEKLLYAYEEKSIGKKTLIFNSGIQSSMHVRDTFTDAGHAIKHLDSTNTAQERRDILEWFKNKPDAVLTSVGILTTGFDEPTVESIILNRATKSLTLYHQMIGRGSRILPKKKSFDVIDLGNNALRFGMWDDYVDWKEIFISPFAYYENLQTDEDIEKNFKYEMPDEIRDQFAKTKDFFFNIKKEYKSILSQGLRPKEVITRSVEQHAQMCMDNSEDVYDARVLAELLEGDIEYRVRTYSQCLASTTKNYSQWLQDDYKTQLRLNLSHKFDLIDAADMVDDEDENLTF